MSSSRRSSRSAHNSRQFPWRTPHSPRNSAPASVSLVFAAPEQGAPLAPASQVIVSTQPETSSIYSNDNASISSQRVAHRSSNSTLQRAQSPVQEVDESHGTIAQPEPVVPESEAGVSASAQKQGISTELRPSSVPAAGTSNGVVAPFPTNRSSTSLPSLTTSAPPPSKASWFRSLTRPRGNESPRPSKMSVVQSLQDARPSEDLDSPRAIHTTEGGDSPSPLPTTVGAVSEQSSQTPAVSPHSAAPLKQPALDSSTPSSHTPTLPTSPQQADIVPPTASRSSPLPLVSITSPKPRSMSPPLTQDSLPSSIDEEVPVVDLSTTLPPPPPVSVSTCNEAKLGTLSVSSSRFALSIPFLGRAKVPLESVLKTEGEDRKVGGLPVAQSAEAKADLSLPQPVTIENAAQDSLQNAIIHPSEPPSILAAEMETSKDKDIEPPLQQMSAATAAEQSTVRAPQTEPPDSWWSYLGWSSSSAPSGPVTSTSLYESASMSIPPSESGLRQSDSPSGTQATKPGSPLFALPLQSPESIDSRISPTKDSAPGKASGISQSTSGHANETREEKVVKPAGPINSNGYDVSNTSGRDTLPRSLDTQERNSNETQQQQLESAEQLGAVVSSPNAPPIASWFSPWSWNFHASNQVNVGPSDTGNNEEGRMENMGGGDPVRVTCDGGECRLPDDTGADTDGRKRTSMASDGENQNVGVGVGAVAQGRNLGQSKGDRENAGNGTDADAELTGSSESAINPIEQSITTHRSGWASLFSSRRLIVRAIGYGSTLSVDTGEVKRDENGIEVMDVDFDEDATSAEERNNEDQDQNQSSDGDTNGKSVRGVLKGRGGTEASRDGVTKPPQSAPPLTTSEDIKKETVQSNPANVKKGISAPSSKPTSGSTTPVPRPSTPTGRVSSALSNPSVTIPPAGGPRDRKRTASPAPSSKRAPPPPNIVLPTWEDIFHMPPRSVIPPSAPAARGGGSSKSTGGKLLEQAVGFFSGVLFSKDGTAPGTGNKGELCGGAGDGDHNDGKLSAVEKERKERFQHFGKELPRAWEAVERSATCPVNSRIGDLSSPSTSASQTFWNKSGRFATADKDRHKDGGLGPSGQKHVYDVLRGCKRVVVIGVHGWFPGAVVRTVLGEPTGTSGKFVNMMIQALENFQQEHGVFLEKITGIPLEGEGTIERRVEKLYSNLSGNQEWMNDIHAADAIFVATHSQGSVVSTHLLDRLIRDRHICTSKSGQLGLSPDITGNTVIQSDKPQRVCCLALCGIHLGPLRYLSSSTFVQPYIQYFESSAARELFEFQNTESAVSKSYVSALRYVLDSGAKMVYVASLNDQVVPIYSGLFTAVSHPLILRALYIDGDAYHSSDFLSNLLVLLIRILNAGISDSGLLAHLSEATAGSLSGVGHSTAYEEISTYALAVKYLFLTDDGLADHSTATLESFNANHEQNDYEIPWALRDAIADERVVHYFATEIAGLRDAFRDWYPKTTILRDLKRKLQPIQRLPSTFSSQNSAYKL